MRSNLGKCWFLTFGGGIVFPFFFTNPVIFHPVFGTRMEIESPFLYNRWCGSTKCSNFVLLLRIVECCNNENRIDPRFHCTLNRWTLFNVKANFSEYPARLFNTQSPYQNDFYTRPGKNSIICFYNENSRFFSSKPGRKLNLIWPYSQWNAVGYWKEIGTRFLVSREGISILIPSLISFGKKICVTWKRLYK